MRKISPIALMYLGLKCFILQVDTVIYIRL